MSRKLPVWETSEYYKTAHKASLDSNHPSMKLLKKLSKNKKILDLGCGEGTRLRYLSKYNNNQNTGVDISEKAIKIARKKDNHNDYKIADLEKLPFKDEIFDLVYSAFVLEHTDNIKKVIDEALRVTKTNGDIVFVCPNFGSPSRKSPPAKYNRFKKLLVGFFEDIYSLFHKSSSLNLTKVEPLKKEYFIDSDTTIEPYLRKIKDYLIKNSIKVEYGSSLWEKELKKASFIQRIFRYLGEKGIYPFSYWGPQLLIHGRKL